MNNYLFTAKFIHPEMATIFLSWVNRKLENPVYSHSSEKMIISFTSDEERTRFNKTVTDMWAIEFKIGVDDGS